MATELSVSRIEEYMYFIRGRKVMLDSDLAQLYEVETRVLNQAVRRNPKRFPGDDFMFQLTREEYDRFKANFGAKGLKQGCHRKYLPTVFTKCGLVMLSGVLNSKRAIEINIAVVRAVVDSRRKFSAHQHPTSGPHQVENNGIGGLFLDQDKTSLASEIKRAVASYYNIKTEDLDSSTRLRTISLPRQIAIYLVRNLTQMGFRDIGKVFGGKDHSTALHAFQKISSLISQSSPIQDSIKEIERWVSDRVNKLKQRESSDLYSSTSIIES